MNKMLFQSAFLTAVLTLLSISLSPAAAQTLPPDRAAPRGIKPVPGLTLPPAGAPVSRAYTVVMDRHYTTNPPRAGECPREVHDRYWTYGPDGKVYPAWHPPVDPVTGCAFGHEHGDNPAQSKLTNMTVPFGYANEKLYELDLVNVRDEDHVGHKVLVENDMPFGANGSLNGVRCDFLAKFHQGTHSADALANNLHEVQYNATCNNGIDVRWKSLHPFGPPGDAFVNCTRGMSDYLYNFGAAVPANSPTGGGQRNLPDSGCITAAGVNMSEDWPMDIDLTLPNGGAFGFGFYFQVADASRFVNFSNGMPSGIARAADICEQLAHPGYASPECVAQRQRGRNIAWDDPRSAWKGVLRRTHVNQLTANDPNRAVIWYTDAFGKQPARTVDVNRGIVIPHVIRGNSDAPNEGGQVSRDYSHPTVRAPN